MSCHLHYLFLMVDGLIFVRTFASSASLVDFLVVGLVIVCTLVTVSLVDMLGGGALVKYDA